MNDSKKLLTAMLGDRGYEVLEKAIFKQRTQAVIDPLEYYLPLIVVPRTIISWLVQTIRPMKTGEIKDVKFPGREDIAIHFEKQDIDQYRAEFVSGGRVIHTFEKQSLPAASAHLMTVGELYDDFTGDKPKSNDDLIEEEIDKNPKLDEPKDMPKPGYETVQQMISMANVAPPHDPESIKWEMSHANVRELTAVIGKLVDSLTAKQMFSSRLEGELDKVSEKEVNGDPQKRENSTTPEDKNLADIKATAANPAIEEKQQSIIEVRDNKADATSENAAIPEIKTIKDGEEAASGDIKKESLHEASMQAAKNIASPRMAGAQNDQDQQKGILPRMSRDGASSKSYFKKKAEILLKPYVSDAQRKKFHAMENRGEMSHATVAHWDKESKGKDLPEHVNKDEKGVHPAGSHGDGVAVQRNFIDHKNRVHNHKRNLRDLKQMPKPNLPKSEMEKGGTSSAASGIAANAAKDRTEQRRTIFGSISTSIGTGIGGIGKQEMGKAEMPKGAGQPKGPKLPEPPKPPVPAGNQPASQASKQAQASGQGGYKPPQTPGAVMPKNPTVKPKAAVAKSGDYFRNKLGKAEKFSATEEQLYKSSCNECGKPEFVKGADDVPVFNPCACFRVLKKDEEGRPYKFVQALKKTDGSYGLEFAKDADPETIKIFLLTLKSRLLLNKRFKV